MKFRLISATLAASGIGAITGVCWERHKKQQLLNNDSNDGLSTGYGKGIFNSLLPRTAFAATSATLPVVSGGGVVKHGYPSLDNLRLYDGFVLSVDRRNRVPLWVFEHLTKERVKYNENVKRTNCQFTEDPSVHAYFRATNNDYLRSGYDRGHLAAAANHRISQTAMEQTFFLTNIAPQIGGLNQKGWNSLEKFVRNLTKDYDNVYVCTGPLYLPRKEADGKKYVRYEVIGDNNVAVPTHFFKVVVCEKGSVYDLLSFVMPNQDVPENVNLMSYAYPVEAVERASGLLLFDKIPKSTFRSINKLQRPKGG